MSTIDRDTPAALTIEKHYSVAELAELWGMSWDTIKRLFEDEPGVLKFGLGTRFTGRKKYRRRYFILRIPAAVALRVQDRLTAQGAGAAAHAH